MGAMAGKGIHLVGEGRPCRLLDVSPAVARMITDPLSVVSALSISWTLPTSKHANIKAVYRDSLDGSLRASLAL